MGRAEATTLCADPRPTSPGPGGIRVKGDTPRVGQFPPYSSCLHTPVTEHVLTCALQQHHRSQVAAMAQWPRHLPAELEVAGTSTGHFSVGRNTKHPSRRFLYRLKRNTTRVCVRAFGARRMENVLGWSTLIRSQPGAPHSPGTALTARLYPNLNFFTKRPSARYHVVVNVPVVVKINLIAS